MSTLCPLSSGPGDLQLPPDTARKIFIVDQLIVHAELTKKHAEERSQLESKHKKESVGSKKVPFCLGDTPVFSGRPATAFFTPRHP